MNSFNVGRFDPSSSSAISFGPSLITPVDFDSIGLAQVKMTTVKFISLLKRVFKMVIRDIWESEGTREQSSN